MCKKIETVELPQHEHDCDCCIFLGRSENFDLYVHLRGIKTVIARYGIDGEYLSGLFASDRGILKEARERAEKLSLL